MPDSAQVIDDVALPGDRRDRAGDWVAAPSLAGQEAGAPAGLTEEAPAEPPSQPGGERPDMAFESADLGATTSTDRTEIASRGPPVDPSVANLNATGAFAQDSSQPRAVQTGTVALSTAVVSEVLPAQSANEVPTATSIGSALSVTGPVSVLSANFPSQALLPGQLSEFVQELASVLAGLEALLTSKVFAESLPLLGNVLGTSAAQSVKSAIGAFHTFDTKLMSQLQTLQDGITSQQLADALNTAAAAAGFAGVIGASVNSNNALVVDFNESGMFGAGTVRLDPGFGLPGLGFVTPTAAATVSLGYTFNEQIIIPEIGLPTADSVSGPELAVSVDVGTPSFGVDVDLGFLKYAATDAGSSLHGIFDVSSSGSVGFQGSANLAINLQTDLGNANFPSLSAELAGSWQFGNSTIGSFATVDPADPSSFGDTPTIELKDVTLNIGTFLKQFLLPIYNEFMAVISPFQPVIDLFNSDNLIPFLSQFLKTSPDAINYLDKAGLLSLTNPNGFVGDGKVTLLDFMALDTGNAAFQTFVKAISAINSFEQLGTILGLAGSGQFDLGSFKIADDIRAPNFDITTDIPTIEKATQDLHSALANLSGLSLDQVDVLQRLLQGNGPGSNAADRQEVTIGSPLLSDPVKAAELLLGADTPDLFTLTLTPPPFEEGHPFDSPPQDKQLGDFPLLVVPGGLDFVINGALGAELNLQFGYDTSGLKSFAAGGFKDLSQLSNGFYLAPVVHNGSTLPVFNLIGDFFAGGSALDIIDGGGFLHGFVDAAFAAPGKQYLLPLQSVLQNSPASLWSLNGQVAVGARFDVLADGATIYSSTPFSATLPLFNIGGSGSAEPGSPGPIHFATNPDRGELDNTGTRSPSFNPDDFEAQYNWSAPSFNISNDGSVAYFGDGTVSLNAIETIDLIGGITKTLLVHNVTIAGTFVDDLQSLSVLGSDASVIAQASQFPNVTIVRNLDGSLPQTQLIQNGGTIIIEGTGADSRNFSQMTITNLGFSGGFANLGTINLQGTLGVDSLSHFYGPGTLQSETTPSFIQPFNAPADLTDLPTLPATLKNTLNARLENDGNTIKGAIQIAVPVTNKGTINADSTIGPLQILGDVANYGLLEAAPATALSLSARTSLVFASQHNIFNYGGTIAAANGGDVFFGNNDTIWGGLLISQTPTAALVTGFAVQGAVTFDGNVANVAGPDGATTTPGIDVEGTVNIGALGLGAFVHPSTLTLTGLIDSKPYSANPGGSIIEAIGPQSELWLLNATLQGGEIATMPSGTVAAGVIRVVQTATIDSIENNPGVAIGGFVQVDNGASLVLAANVVPDLVLPSGIEVGGGTLRIGVAGKDKAVLAANTIVQGDLRLTDGATNLVTGFDASAVLENDWTIEGAGTLGDGKVQIINEPLAPLIAGQAARPGGLINANATHPLIVNSGSRGAINQSLMEATNGGVLDLTGNVNNAGGTIAANGGVVSIDGVTIAGGLLTESLGLFFAAGNAGLDGSGSALTIDTGLALTVGTNGFLTVKGAIVNHGTILVQANAASLALMSVDQSATLSGGGEVRFIDPVAAPGVGHAGLSAASAAFTLDNKDNLIDGTGVISVATTNEAAGVIAAGAGVLSVVGPVINAGLMESNGGTLFVTGSVTNTGGTVAANGGQVVLSGGTIASGDTGTIEAISAAGKSGTVTLNGVVKGGFIVTDAQDPNSIVLAGTAGGKLDGTVNTVTLTAGSGLLIGAGDLLSLTGTLSNQGSIGIAGNVAAATLQVVANAVLTGGGSITLSDASGVNTTATQIVTGLNSATLDNIDNTISGIGLLGSGSIKLTNEIGGRILAIGGTLEVDGGSAGFINHGQVTATTVSTLVLAGNVVDTGDTLVADGGTIIIQGTVAGGSFATPNDGVILMDSGTLDGRANTITIPSGVTVNVLPVLPSPGVNTNMLEGAIANLGEIFLQSDSSKSNNKRSILIGGTARLTGGGLIAMFDLSATAAGAADLILGSAGTDTLDNVDNNIVGFGTIGGTGAGALTLTNESAGIVDAAGGELFLNLFAPGNHSFNQGLIEAIGGTLDLSGTIVNAGGTIQSLNDGTPHSGTVLIDGLTIMGGTLAGDQTDLLSLISTTTKNGTLDGSAAPVTIANTGQLLVVHDSKLTLLGSIVDQGTITVTGIQEVGASFGTGDARLAVSGTVTLSGTGSVILNHISAAGNWIGSQIVAGTSTADRLNNGVTISGTGSLGANALTLNNLAQGVVSANGGTLFVDTGLISGQKSIGNGVAVTNAGLLTALSTGVLDLRTDVTNIGGTIAASGSGLTVLESNIVTGGTFDGAGGGRVIGRFATIDASASPVTLLAGAAVGVSATLPNPSDQDGLLTVKGTFINHGTLFVEGSSAQAGSRTLQVSGSINLSGGGQVLLIDIAASKGGFGDKLFGNPGTVANVFAINTLDNVDNLISGVGQLANPSLMIVNEAAGVISAAGGTLRVNTLGNVNIPTAGGVINKGTIQAFGGTLDLAALIDNRGGLVRALNDGAGHSGTIILRNATLQGGAFASDPGDSASLIQAINGTLDGTLGTVTLGVGTPMRVLPGGILTLTGAIANLGTVMVEADTVHGAGGTLQISGTAHLSGGGRVALSDLSNANARLDGTIASDTLDNIDNTIIGFGRIGFTAMTLVNEATGTVAAQGGFLSVGSANATITDITNLGLLEALGGTLDLQGTIANVGGTIAARNDGAGHSGTVVLDRVTVHGGTLTGDPADAASVFNVTSQTSILDGLANTVTLTPTAKVQVAPSTPLTLQGTILDQGTIALAGSGVFFDQAILQVAGTATLKGGGIISLTDASGKGSTLDQIVTGIVATDVLDNAGVTITGVGLLGNHRMTLVNEAAGTIVANGGSLIVDTGKINVTNQGLMGASASGTLDILSPIFNAGGIIGGGGIVLLEASATIAGGTMAGGVFGNGGTVDGTTNAVTIAAGATLGAVASIPNPYSKSLTLRGAIVNQGTIVVQGDDSGLAVNDAVTIAGTVTLTGGGLVSLTGKTAKDTGTATFVMGSSVADTLDNANNTIAGFGRLGGGVMSVINETTGTINAIGGTLTVATGTGAIANQGLLTSGAKGVLDLISNVANAGGTISADGGETLLDNITVLGGTLSGSLNGTILIVNNTTLDGTAGAIDVAPAASLSVAANATLTVTGAVAINGTISNSGSIAAGVPLVLDGTLINNGLLSGGVTLTGTGNLTNNAGKTVPGTVTATTSGETIFNLGKVAGAVSLAGGDRLVTGAGAVFAGGISGGAGGNTLEIAKGPFALTNFNAAGTPQYSTLQIDAGVTVTPDATDILTGVTLINQGQLNLTAFTAGGPVQNDGSITGDITLTSGVPLINSAGGTISGSGLAVIQALGLASVTNSGVIDPASFGVDLTAGGTVTNTTGGVIDGSVAGVVITGGPGTVTNGGTISGGTNAVSLAAGFANRVIVDPGAVFSGIVDGGNVVGGTIASTLELAGVAGATALSGLGSQFVNFSTVAIDSGSYVLLIGTNTLGAGVTLTEAGTFGITGGATLTEAAPGLVSGSVTTVDGVGSFWNAAGGLVAGDTTNAGIVVSGKGSLTSAGLVLGASAGGNGTLTVTGTASVATLSGQITLGQAGAGVLAVSNNATVIAGGTTLAPAGTIDLGQAAGGAGAISVTGTRSLLSNAGGFVVGDAGTASLSIAGGGTVITTAGSVLSIAALIVANTSGADGSWVEVSGPGSNLQVTGLLDVGVAGSGALSLSGGANATVGSIDAGGNASSVGRISVTGAGTSLNVTGDATVADDGTGVLSVLNGATFSATNLTIGSQGDSSGALIVSGNGSVINLTGSLNIGTALGVGDLTIGPGGAVHAAVVNLQGQVVLEGGNLDPTVTIINQGQTAGGNGTLQAGDIIDEGVIQAGGTKPSQRLLVVQGTVMGGGTLSINGTVQPSNAVGVLQINASGTMELTGPVLNAATTTFTDNLAQPGTYTVNNSVVDVTFADAFGVLLLDDIGGFGGTITSFKGGDSFVITGGTLSNLGVSNSNTLTFSDGGLNAASGGIDQIIFGTSVSAANFNIVNGNTVQVACFAAGTRIETVNGPVAIEKLIVGERVIARGAEGDWTLAGDTRSEPVVWVGSRSVNCAAHPKPKSVWPVRVRAGAFGAGLPARDLWLSPDHAVFVNNVLVPVKLLINGTTIAQVKRPAVVYYHVELPRHDVILAEGLPVESYLDTDDRADFANLGETTRLFPDFSARLTPDAAWAWEARGAAPLVMTGPLLAEARNIVAARVSRDNDEPSRTVWLRPGLKR